MSWIYVAVGRSINFHTLSLLHCVSTVKFVTQYISTTHDIIQAAISLRNIYFQYKNPSGLLYVGNVGINHNVRNTVVKSSVLIPM